MALRCCEHGPRPHKSCAYINELLACIIGRAAKHPVRMNNTLARQAGKALVWKAVQQGGVNVTTLLRVLILAALLAPEDFGLLAIAMSGIDFLLRITDLE